MEKSTKEIIIETAIGLFSELGYTQTSMRMIAEKSGITKPAIYYYFPDKESLFIGILEHGMEEVNNTLQKIAQSDMSTVDKLKKIMRTRLVDMDRHKSFGRFIMQVLNSHLKENMATRFHEWMSKQSAVLYNIVRQGVDKGEFREDLDARSFVYCLLGGMNQFGHDKFQSNDPAIPVNQEELLFETLIRCAQKV